MAKPSIILFKPLFVSTMALKASEKAHVRLLYLHLTFRVPPLVTEIPKSMLYNCRSIYSIEIPHNVKKINYGAFL